MTRLAAAAMLETFPNTTMTLGYVRGPAWVPPAAVRRAAAFIDAHPDRAVTLEDVAAAAGVTGRALQYAFRRRRLPAAVRPAARADAARVTSPRRTQPARTTSVGIEPSSGRFTGPIERESVMRLGRPSRPIFGD